MLFEEKFIFKPERYPAGLWSEVAALQKVSSRELSPQIKNISLSTLDGETLHAWHCFPQRFGQAKPSKQVLLYFHGRHGNLSHCYELISHLMQLRIEILCIDYRGYGKSSGSPSQQGLRLDAHAAWDYLRYKCGFMEQNIVTWGQELGAAIAIELAASVNPAGLIIQSAFTCMADLLSVRIPIFPERLLKNRFDSREKIRTITCPKLLIHGTTDQTVPVGFGLKLFERALEPKDLYILQNASHSNLHQKGAKAYLHRLKGFIYRCCNVTDPILI